tara:strand:+ start:19501 stop:19758 length:258 start_codon:yes stop_codon:yes gene_type:complete
MISEIKKWGNGSAVRLSNKLLAAAGLNPDSAVSITAESGRITIDKIDDVVRGNSIASIKGIVSYSGEPVSLGAIDDAIKSRGGQL